MIRKLALCILVALLIAWPAGAQMMTTTLGGRIFDGNGPIEGVTVVAINQTTNAQYYATTGRGGWYHIQNIVPGGPFTVRIHYFGYAPLTVRDQYWYAGQNIVVDADLEAGETFVRLDEAGTSMVVGEVMGEPANGGEVPFSPLTYSLMGQHVYIDVPFDVRQEASLDGVYKLSLTQSGSSTFHASALGLYDVKSYDKADRTGAFTGNVSVSTPLGSEDYQVFAGLQYGTRSGFEGLGRFDARFNESNRFDVSGGHYAGETWAAGGLTSAVGDAASNRIQAGWTSIDGERNLLVSDDFSYAVGSQQLLFGVMGGRWSNPVLDTASTHFDFYAQDIIRFGRRLTVQAGLRFGFPFAFSPRASVFYDVLGNGKLVLRAGTAVYGHPGASVWKNLAAVDVALPAEFVFTVEGTYGQLIKQLFYIKQGNVMESAYSVMAKLERPLFDGAWVAADYTHSNGPTPDRVTGGFYYKKAYARHFATAVAFLYDGFSLIDDYSPASLSWMNHFQARISQDFIFEAAGRSHTLQLTAYTRRTVGVTQVFAGLRYLL